MNEDRVINYILHLRGSKTVSLAHYQNVLFANPFKTSELEQVYENMLYVLLFSHQKAQKW